MHILTTGKRVAILLCFYNYIRRCLYIMDQVHVVAAPPRGARAIYFYDDSSCNH